jgi:hypothetical protein
MSYPQPKLPSSYELIAKHSTARVLVRSLKPFGVPGQSRPMIDDDVKAQMLRQYG